MEVIFGVQARDGALRVELDDDKSRRAPQAARRGLQRRQGRPDPLGQGQGRPRRSASRSTSSPTSSSAPRSRPRTSGSRPPAEPCAPRTPSCATSKAKASATSSAIPARPRSPFMDAMVDSRSRVRPVPAGERRRRRRRRACRKPRAVRRWSTCTPGPASRRRCRPSTWRSKHRAPVVVTAGNEDTRFALTEPLLRAELVDMTSRS